MNEKQTIEAAEKIQLQIVHPCNVITVEETETCDGYIHSMPRKLIAEDLDKYRISIPYPYEKKSSLEANMLAVKTLIQYRGGMQLSAIDKMSISGVRLSSRRWIFFLYLNPPCKQTEG